MYVSNIKTLGKAPHRLMVYGKSSARAAAAFSLVELVFVMGVIGVLMSIMVPVAHNGIKKAEKLQIQNNMRKICQTYRSYLADDHAAIRVTNLKAFAKKLATETGLGAHDASVWRLKGTSVPKSVLTDTWNGAESEFKVNKNVTLDSHPYTPFIWTAGLEGDAAFADANKNKPKFICLWNGDVVECQKDDDVYLYDGKNFVRDIKTVLDALTAL